MYLSEKLGHNETVNTNYSIFQTFPVIISYYYITILTILQLNLVVV